MDIDCKKFMETFTEVAESQQGKEENKDASNAAGLLEKLTVEDKKEEEKTNGSSEEVKEETEKVVEKATPEKAEADSEKKEE